MNTQELRELISTGLYDIEFDYSGKQCSVCAFSKEKISLAHDGDVLNVDTVDKAMDAPFFDGRSLAEIASEVEFEY